MKSEKQIKMQNHLEMTETRLQEISQSGSSLEEKQIQVAVNLCLFLRDVTEAYLSEEDQGKINKMVDLFIHLG